MVLDNDWNSYRRRAPESLKTEQEDEKPKRTGLLALLDRFELFQAFPDRVLSLGAGLVFLGFAGWTLLMGDDEPEEAEAEEAVDHAKRRSRSAAVAAGTALFVAELGDKTMLAAATLAARYGAFQVWFGATIGMGAALLIAVVLGRGMAQRLSPRMTRYVAAGAFALFGALLLLDAARG